MKTSIIIPVVRPEKAKWCIEAIHANAGIPRKDYEILFLEDTKRIGCPKMVKKLVSKARFKTICFLGDDTLPMPNFLKRAQAAMKHFPDKWGLVGLNDQTNSGLATHWLAHKKLLLHLGGEFFHTGYTHCFCDNELMSRCQQMGRYIYAYDSVIKHENPLVDKSVETDADYKRVYDQKVFERDRALFTSRAENNWETPDPAEEKPGPTKVLVGVPSGDMVHAGFAMNLLALVTYAMQTGINIATINQNSSIIEVGRNTIVQHAINFNCDYLLTIDSDMLFPASLLNNLLAHKKDIVCCDASKRREPFGSVCTGLDDKPLDHINGSGLVEVKGGTSAIQLVTVKALLAITPPHYAVTWDDETGTKFVGEDYYFNAKALKHGFKTYCDMDLSKDIGHIGLKEFYIPKAEELDKTSK